jgi:hypothetical protein
VEKPCAFVIREKKDVIAEVDRAYSNIKQEVAHLGQELVDLNGGRSEPTRIIEHIPPTNRSWGVCSSMPDVRFQG